MSLLSSHSSIIKLASLKSTPSAALSLLRRSYSSSQSTFLDSFMSQPGPIFLSIQTKINHALAPTLLNIIDDSAKHKGHAGLKGLRPAETHFRLVVVSDAFAAKSLVQRHRLIYEILDQEMKGGVHALSLTTKTPDEFESTKK